MRAFSFAVIAASALTLCAFPVFADNLYPPEWRGQPGTTWQAFEFPDDNPILTPDAGYNPYGTATGFANPLAPEGWYAEYHGRNGVWPFSGNMTFDIPNSSTPNPQKDIWVQLTWQAAPTASHAYPTVTETDSGIRAELIQQLTLPDGWKHSTYRIVLPYNPTHEHVFLQGNILLDEAIIDTICVGKIPEPSTVALLGTAGVGLVLGAWRRWLRRRRDR